MAVPTLDTPTPRIALHLRSPAGAPAAPRKLTALDWPERHHHPTRGWPIWIPPTTDTSYLGGYDALNLPTLPGQPRLGDWHEDGAWWSATYLKGDGQPDVAELWGSAGTLEGVPGVPELHDARPALAQIEHPAASNASPVLCATVAQAILDLAWHELSMGGPGPGRREMVSWTDDTEEDRVRRLAIARQDEIEDPDALARWRAWQTRSLAGDDPFYTSRPQLSGCVETVPRVNLVIDSGPPRR